MKIAKLTLAPQELASKVAAGAKTAPAQRVLSPFAQNVLQTLRHHDPNEIYFKWTQPNTLQGQAVIHFLRRPDILPSSIARFDENGLTRAQAIRRAHELFTVGIDPKDLPSALSAESLATLQNPEEHEDYKTGAYFGTVAMILGREFLIEGPDDDSTMDDLDPIITLIAKNEFVAREDLKLDHGILHMIERAGIVRMQEDYQTYQDYCCQLTEKIKRLPEEQRKANVAVIVDALGNGLISQNKMAGEILAYALMALPEQERAQVIDEKVLLLLNSDRDLFRTNAIRAICCALGAIAPARRQHYVTILLKRLNEKPNDPDYPEDYIQKCILYNISEALPVLSPDEVLETMTHVEQMYQAGEIDLESHVQFLGKCAPFLPPNAKRRAADFLASVFYPFNPRNSVLHLAVPYLSEVLLTFESEDEEMEHIDLLIAELEQSVQSGRPFRASRELEKILSRLSPDVLATFCYPLVCLGETGYALFKPLLSSLIASKTLNGFLGDEWVQVDMRTLGFSEDAITRWEEISFSPEFIDHPERLKIFSDFIYWMCRLDDSVQGDVANYVSAVMTEHPQSIENFFSLIEKLIHSPWEPLKQFLNLWPSRQHLWQDESFEENLLRQHQLAFFVNRVAGERIGIHVPAVFDSLSQYWLRSASQALRNCSPIKEISEDDIDEIGLAVAQDLMRDNLLNQLIQVAGFMSFEGCTKLGRLIDQLYESKREGREVRYDKLDIHGFDPDFKERWVQDVSFEITTGHEALDLDNFVQQQRLRLAKMRKNGLPRVDENTFFKNLVRDVEELLDQMQNQPDFGILRGYALRLSAVFESHHPRIYQILGSDFADMRSDLQQLTNELNRREIYGEMGVSNLRMTISGKPEIIARAGKEPYPSDSRIDRAWYPGVTTGNIEGQPITPMLHGLFKIAALELNGRLVTKTELELTRDHSGNECLLVTKCPGTPLYQETKNILRHQIEEYAVATLGIPLERIYFEDDRNRMPEARKPKMRLITLPQLAEVLGFTDDSYLEKSESQITLKRFTGETQTIDCMLEGVTVNWECQGRWKLSMSPNIYLDEEGLPFIQFGNFQGACIDGKDIVRQQIIDHAALRFGIPAESILFGYPEREIPAALHLGGDATVEFIDARATKVFTRQPGRLLTPKKKK